MNKWLVNILMLHVEMIPLAYKGRSMPPIFFYITSCILAGVSLKNTDSFLCPPQTVLSNCFKWQFVIHMYMVEYFCILHASKITSTCKIIICNLFMLTCNVIKWTCNTFISISEIDMLTCDSNYVACWHWYKSHVNIIMLHVDM